MEDHCFKDDVLGSTLPQQLNIHESQQIFISGCRRTFAMNVNLQRDSVEDVKRAIEELEGIPVKEQHLVVCGKPLRQGTFLRDYDALGYQSTIDVSMRLRGGAPTEEIRTLHDFVTSSVTSMQGLTDDSFFIPEQKTLPVLSKLGRRILHGVLSCVLSAHGAGLVYNDDNNNENNDDDDSRTIKMQDFRVHCYVGKKELVRVVYVGGATAPESSEDNLIGQAKDYKALQKVIEELFPMATMPLQVENIQILLGKLAAGIPAITPEKRTQLLKAHAAMVSSSVGVATMFFNLKRLYDQFRSHKFTFEEAMTAAQATLRPTLPATVQIQNLFETVYGEKYKANSRAPRQGDQEIHIPYAGPFGMFLFARNWFTHVPAERWPSPNGSEGPERFTELPQLDHIFTHYFSNFLPEALLQLYMKFDDHNLLTEVLVPIA